MHKDRTYLILTSQVLVGEDMAQCIVELFPDAQVLQFRTTDTLHEALASLGAVDTAFLEARSVAHGCEKVIAALEALGGKIVLLGAEDDEVMDGPKHEDRQWRGLPMPFDTAMLRQRLV